MKIDKEKPPYLPKVAFVRLHTAGKTVKEYQQEYKGQGFTYKQFEHMKRADEYWDNLELWVSMWDYDNHTAWHLWNWKKKDDNRVMLAMYEAEQYHPFMRFKNDFERFKALWESGEYDPGCTYTFPLESVEVLEVVQEEQKNTDPEKVKKTVQRSKEENIQRQRRERATKRKYRYKKKRR